MKTGATIGITVASVVVLGTVFFVGLCCGVSLAGDSDSRSVLVSSATSDPTQQNNPPTYGPGSTVIYNAASADTAANMPAAGNGDSRFQINGVEYDLSGEPCTVRTTADGLEMTSADATLQVSGGRLSMNGVKYGRVPSGGRVKITSQGVLFINGVRRTANQHSVD